MLDADQAAEELGFHPLTEWDLTRIILGNKWNMGHVQNRLLTPPELDTLSRIRTYRMQAFGWEIVQRVEGGVMECVFTKKFSGLDVRGLMQRTWSNDMQLEKFQKVKAETRRLQVLQQMNPHAYVLVRDVDSPTEISTFRSVFVRFLVEAKAQHVSGSGCYISTHYKTTIIAFGMKATEPKHEDAARNDSEDAIASRLVKKIKVSPEETDLSGTSSRLEHPLGVKPVGNFFEDAVNGIVECRVSGLGRLAILKDSTLLALLGYCTAKDLAQLTASSRAGYVYGSHDELWRVLVLEEMESQFEPRSTWKNTYLTTKYGDNAKLSAPIRVKGVYSDLLFQSFYCAAAPIEDAWLAVENIERRNAKQLTLEDFKRDFEGPNVPVIIEDAIDEWPAMEKWTDGYLAEVCNGLTFYAGGFQFAMDKYFKYARTLVDDQPLFVFDKEFAAKVPQLAEDYTVPKYFQEDYFALLGEENRPNYRWLIIGPKKSGSGFHIDPNATNAWNGVIRGSKKWIMFPPGQVPPGIHPSEDGSEVSAPVSLMEWFVTFYKEVQKLPAHLKPLEGICREGETMFVPHGWWHTVLNIEESVAMTQNFVSSGNVKSVLQFLTEKPDQVSGCPTEQRPKLGGMFRDVISKQAPDLFAKVNKELQEEYERAHRKTKWELLISEDDNEKDVSPYSTSDAAATTNVAVSSNSASTFGFGFSFD
ncbi:hypothetical protein JM16_006507 [Phytophthora kernoviae]|nr:hypothetical protein JM16_006507 [Phytophthora kernoviae]